MQQPSRGLSCIVQAGLGNDAVHHKDVGQAGGLGIFGTYILDNDGLLVAFRQDGKLSAGFKNITMCDKQGALYVGCPGMNWAQAEMAERTNPDQTPGTLAEKLVGADVFIGTSAPGLVTRQMVETMNRDAIIFACANPTPEIFPEEAKAGGARIVSTGRSDYPNQINNVLAFPGIFRGVFDVRASDINEEMKLAAAEALAGLISEEELSDEYIMPAALDDRVAKTVADAVAKAAVRTGVARI